MSVLFIVGSQLNEGEVLGSNFLCGRYDVIWNFDR